MTEIKTNRNHKDSVFTLLFSEPNAALELYNAVTGQNYPPDTKIEIVTLAVDLINHFAFRATARVALFPFRFKGKKKQL